MLLIQKFSWKLLPRQLPPQSPFLPHFHLLLNGPFVLLSAVCGQKVKKTWMRHTRADWCAKCSSVCSVLFCVCLYRRPHNLLHIPTNWGDKLFTNSLHAHGQFKLCTCHAVAANDTNPRPFSNPCPHPSTSLPPLYPFVGCLFFGQLYAANRT